MNRLNIRLIDHSAALQLRIDTRVTAGIGPLRSAQPADAPTLAELLERATEELELSRTWTAADVARRAPAIATAGRASPSPTARSSVSSAAVYA